jgi:hypothetical protein
MLNINDCPVVCNDPEAHYTASAFVHLSRVKADIHILNVSPFCLRTLVK